VLEADPTHCDTAYLLAAIAHRGGRSGEGDALLRQAVEARAHWIRLGYRPPDWPRHDAAPHAMTALNRPRRVIEVGSGNSTKFIRRAIRDHGLPTAIVSIDPQPRGRRSDPLT